MYQSSRYITDRFLPDKAIDLVDEAGARAKLKEAGYSEEFGEINKSIRVAVEQMENAVSQKDFERACSTTASRKSARENLQFVPVRREVERAQDRRQQVGHRRSGVQMDRCAHRVHQPGRATSCRMEGDLHKRVVSQEKAISAISRAIRRSRAGLKNPNRPVGSFIFWTDRRRQNRARAGLANFLFGSDNALIRFDMSEYMEKHSVSS